MIAAGSLEYAFARMQARLSKRPSEGTWAAIEEARTLVPIHDAARGTSLERLLEILPPQADLQDVDRAARAAWSRAVKEAASWMPAEWGPALAWCDSARAPHPTLMPSLGHPGWRKRWPAGEDDPALDELARFVAGHLARFRIALPHEANTLRRAFEARLLAFFRRHPVQAAAAFAWLALAALDLERLRGEIERRLAFPAARIAA
ncbi:MAG: hypothetical protein NDI88_02975 [Lysobacter sp.]|nr:hypothetical protein [Lysobacter sp.]